MLKILCQCSWNRRFFSQPLKRFFLSNAYKCSEAWENRLTNPVIKKINFENLYYHLDKVFLSNSRVNVLDIDLFASSLTNYQYKNELENLLVKLRNCPECVLLPERTTHAVVRFYLENAPKEDIFNILSNRLIFGIFPDKYLSNLLMDKFVKDNDTVSSVKIAVLQMLQEDLDHPITNVLALYCCYNYLDSSEVWETPKPPEPDPDEEVEKVRVNYLRNPYFDDHFDIVTPNHLIGKTLWLFGISLGGTLGASSQLVGLVLYEKYEKSVLFLENIIKSNTKIYTEAVNMAKEFLNKMPKQMEEETNNKDQGDQPTESKKSETSEVKSNDPWKCKALTLLDQLNKNNLIEGKLLTEAEKMVKESVEVNQAKDIELQCQVSIECI